MAFCQELDPRGTSATDESVSPCLLSCNRSIRVELHGQHKTSNNGALLQRKTPDNSGVINAQGDNLVDLWHPLCIRYSLVSQMGTLVLQRAMGRIGLSDTDKLTLNINGLPIAVHFWIPHLVRRLNESTETHASTPVSPTTTRCGGTGRSATSSTWAGCAVTRACRTWRRRT